MRATEQDREDVRAATLKPEHGVRRAELICASLHEPIDELRRRGEYRPIRPQSLAGELSASRMTNRVATDDNGAACFVIHGIRDNGHWTRKIAQRILDQADRQSKPFTVYTPTYGYFPLISFVLPWTRREKVEWFLDLYVDVFSRHRDGEMIYIGHSNGTYLLAKGLSLCPAMHFDRVLFAGSVVRRSYPWPKRIGTQVLEVVNLVAAGDLVVALFPRAFERLRLQDLGGAGVDGFLLLPAEANRSYVPGHHDAGIREEMWNDIAAFAVDGDLPLEDQRTIGGELALIARKSFWVTLLGGLSPLSWPAMLALIIAGGYWVLFVFSAGETPPPVWQVAVLFAIYSALVARILTKF